MAELVCTEKAGFSIRAGGRQNVPAISYELASYLIEKLPPILRLTWETWALDRPSFIHEKQKNLAWILSNFSGDLCFFVQIVRAQSH